MEHCTFLHCSALEQTNIFVQLSLHITFHAIECGVTFPYKVVIKNHSVRIEGNPIFFNRSQGFTQNFGISRPF